MTTEDEAPENQWYTVPQPEVWEYRRGEYTVTVEPADDKDGEDTWTWQVTFGWDEDDDEEGEPCAQGAHPNIEIAKQCALSVLDILCPPMS